MPVISVLMSVYNGQKFLNEAMQSVLNQSFSDFEFLIVDDGSTDASLSIAQTYKDPRIKLLINEKNLGLIASLNKLIGTAQGKYLARLDCDDVAHSDRFKVQVEAMEQNQNLVLLGSNCFFINEESLIINVGRPHFVSKTDYPDSFIRWLLLFPENPFIHSSVLIRRDTLTHNNLFYSHDARHVEDLDLWTKICQYGQVKILKEPLVKFRLVSNSITSRNNEWQIAKSREICQKMRSKLYEVAGSQTIKDKCLQNELLEMSALYQITSKAPLLPNERALIRKDFCERLVQYAFFGLLKRTLLPRELLFVVKRNADIHLQDLIAALFARIYRKMVYLLSEKRQYG